MANPIINEIRERLNIVEVLSSYISLKKAGTNYKASCPFHHEKTASLMISPSKQIWHCFGCGEGGDVFGFLMRYENIDFPEALKILADRAGVQLPKYTKEAQAKVEYKDKLIAINELAAKYYHEVLERSSVADIARRYLQGRQLSPQTIKEWQLGLAPNEFHILETFLLKRGYKKQELLDAGVSARSQRSDIYDRFFNRITFPIKNFSGDAVGFTARVLDADAKTAKYVNSPETLIYNKSRIIFGLYQAKQAIRKEDCVVVVEGNMDVIACHQAGFKNVVASSGTAFTYEQLEQLARLTKNLKFAFDTDAAGASATKRTLELALQQGFNVFIVKIEGAKDPDELIKKDKEAFARAVKEAPLFMDYYFEKSFAAYNPNDIQQKKKIAADLVSLIKKLSDPLEISHYVRLLGQKLMVPEKSIYEILAKTAAEKQFNPKANKPQAPPLVKNRNQLLEQKVVGCVLFNVEMRDKALEKLETADFTDPQFASIFEQISQQKPQNIEQFLDKLGDLADLAKMALFVVESQYNENPDQAALEREFKKTLRDLKTNSAKIRMDKVLVEMVLAEQKKDKQKLNELNKQFLELSLTLKDNQ